MTQPRPHLAGDRDRSHRSGAIALWLGLLAICLTPNLAPAQVLYWDRNGSSAGSGSNPDGRWINSNGFFFQTWNTNSTGSGGTTRWSNGRDAVFSAGSDAASADYSIAVVGNVRPGAVTVQDGNVTFNSGTIQFNDGTPDFTVAANRTATIGSPAGAACANTAPGVSKSRPPTPTVASPTFRRAR